MRLLFTFLLISLGSVSVHGLEFRVLSWAGPIGGILYQNTARVTEIEGEEGALSRPYLLDGTHASLELFREVEHEGQKVRVSVASIPVPKDLVQGILVLAATDAKRTSFTGLWIDNALAARPANHVQVHNLSSKSVAIRVNHEDLVLPAMAQRQFPYEAGVRSVPLKIAAQTGSRWQLIASRRQAVRENHRLLIILRDGRPTLEYDGVRAAALVDLVTIYDRPPPVLTAAR